MSEKKPSPADRPVGPHEVPIDVDPDHGASPDGRVGPEQDAPHEPEVVEATPAAMLRELEERLKRVQADFVNETRRMQRQADERIRFASEALLQDLLPVFDALHSAREGFASRDASDESAGAALEGFDLVERELLNVLARHGVARIDAEGVDFDPSLHHAIMMVDAPSLPGGAVAKELRPGFTLHERVVRPAHVAVVAERTADRGEEDGEEG